MKTYTLKKSGILYWLATEPGAKYAEDIQDLCTYTRAIIKGLFIFSVAVAMCAVAGGFILFALGSFIGWVCFMIANGVLVAPDAFAFGGTAVLVIAGAVVAFVKYDQWNSERKHQIYLANQVRIEQGLDLLPPPAPGFLRLWLSSKLNKICFRINFE